MSRMSRYVSRANLDYTDAPPTYTRAPAEALDDRR